MAACPRLVPIPSNPTEFGRAWTLLYLNPQQFVDQAKLAIQKRPPRRLTKHLVAGTPHRVGHVAAVARHATTATYCPFASRARIRAVVASTSGWMKKGTDEHSIQVNCSSLAPGRCNSGARVRLQRERLKLAVTLAPVVRALRFGNRVLYCPRVGVDSERVGGAEGRVCPDIPARRPDDHHGRNPRR